MNTKKIILFIFMLAIYVNWGIIGYLLWKSGSTIGFVVFALLSLARFCYCEVMVVFTNHGKNRLRSHGMHTIRRINMTKTTVVQRCAQ